MIDKKLFNKLKKDYSRYNEKRNTIIVRSRDILKFSKQAIFACHRGDLTSAKKSLSEAEKVIKELRQVVKADDKLAFEGSLRAATEEYAEARLLYNYLTTGKVFEIKEVEVDYEIYIGALSDFTGELVRRAVALATERKTDELSTIQTVIEEIMAQFIQFDLLSSLRQKYDQARKNMHKIEEIRYDLSMRE